MKGLHFENRKRAASWRACTPGATPSPCATSEHVSNVTTSDGSFKHYFGQGLLRAPVARLTRPPFGLLLVIFLQLLQQAASVMFDIPPHGRDCFFVKSVNANTELVGSYQTFFGDGSVRVTVEGPVPNRRASGHASASQTPLYSSVNESAAIKTELTTRGEYAVCVRNLLSFDQTVTMDFHTLQHKEAVHPNQLAMEDEALKLKELTTEVLEKASSLFEQQSHAMVRMGLHAELGQSTRRRATLWKCIQIALQVVLSGVHIYAVKSFFEVKTIV